MKLHEDWLVKAEHDLLSSKKLYAGNDPILDFKALPTSIPWKSIAGMRDITAHKYQTLKMGDVWHTVKQDMPVLKAQLASIVK